MFLILYILTCIYWFQYSCICIKTIRLDVISGNTHSIVFLVKDSCSWNNISKHYSWQWTIYFFILFTNMLKKALNFKNSDNNLTGKIMLFTNFNLKKMLFYSSVSFIYCKDLVPWMHMTMKWATTLENTDISFSIHIKWVNTRKFVIISALQNC